jgi:hypothetical protein
MPSPENVVMVGLGHTAALRVQIPNTYSFVFHTLASSLKYTYFKTYLDDKHEDYLSTTMLVGI